MPIRLLAFALLAGVCVAHAAPPKSKDTTSAQTTPESIDVDALARSKDVDGSTPADAPPPIDAANMAPPPDSPPPDAPPVDALPSEAPPVNLQTEPPPGAEPVAPAATVATPAADAEKKETSERISLAGSCQARATSLLDDVEKSDFSGATRAFDAKMHTAMPPPKLKEAWEQLAQFGKLVARGQSHLSSGEGYTLVMIPLIFEKANLVAQIACGTDGRIAGFYVKPVPTPAPNS